MENGGNPSPDAASPFKGMKLGSSRFPVPKRGLVKARIADKFIRSIMAPFTSTTTTTTTVVSKDGTGGEGEDTGAGDGTTGNSSAVSTGMNNSPNGRQ